MDISNNRFDLQLIAVATIHAAIFIKLSSRTPQYTDKIQYSAYGSSFDFQVYAVHTINEWTKSAGVDSRRKNRHTFGQLVINLNIVLSSH